MLDISKKDDIKIIKALHSLGYTLNGNKKIIETLSTNKEIK